MRKKLFTFLLALTASVGLSWAIPTEFANCYDCWRSPDYPTTSGQCHLFYFGDPYVGNNNPSGPWKLEFVEYYNSSSTEYGSNIVDEYVANQYGKSPEQMEVYRLYQWQNGAYQPVAYGVLYAYANENNQVEHAAFFEAGGHYGCYLTGNTHSGDDDVYVTFDEDASTGFADLHPAPAGNSITINESSYGSVVASSSSAAAGETITLTATPNDGYQLKSISGVYEVQANLSETLNATAATVDGNKFQAQATARNLYGWRVYNPGSANTLTISSKDGATLITKIEFTSTFGNSRENNMLSVSKGTLSFDGSDPSTTVTINDINATSVTISGSGTNAAETWCISSAKIYYTGTIENELEISDTENANVKTFTMVDSEVTISAEFEPAPAPANPSGECGAQGDNLLWELNTSTGVLTITGSGAMADWPDDTQRPWYTYYTQITSVVLPNGITSIGTKAFRGLINLTSVNMAENYPASLTTINQEGFLNTGLTSVTIPETVETIGMDAFRLSKKITDVYCYADPNNLTWNDYYCDDFKDGDHATVCHVKDCALATYETNWSGTPYNVYNSTGVNVTFVGDLPGECGGSTPTPTDEQVPTNPDPENPSYHYSTFFHSTQNYALTNDGTQAFVADLSGNDLVLTMIAEGTQVIPANTAVILRKTGSNEPVALVPTTDPGVSFSANNDLQGVDVATTLESLSIDAANCYVLSGKSHDETVSGVGFYRIYGNTLKAHKAYVIYAGGGSNLAPKRMRFIFESEQTATGIDNTNAAIECQKIIENGQVIIIRNGVRYNAAGQIVK